MISAKTSGYFTSLVEDGGAAISSCRRANSRVDPPTIDVLRLLHDSMDLPCQVDSS